MVSNSEPLAEGTVIMADDQYAGRGQHGNTWVSQAGLNLTFSTYLRPFFLPIPLQFQLNVAVSLGLLNALQVYIEDGIKVKWPNDIYYNESKLGGVLIENTISLNALKSSIVGIGINVNQTEFNSILKKRVTSISQILHENVDLTDLLKKICHSIEAQYLMLKAGRHKEQHFNYLKSLYQFDKICSYRSADEVFEGRITGVSDEGKLLVFHNGEEHSYGLKEIEFMDNN